MVSILTSLEEHTTFNINVKDGLKVAGISIGNDEYVKQELAKVISKNVETVFDAVNDLPDLQYQHLLNLNCGGNCRAQNLWQTIRPDLAINGIKQVDNLTKKVVSPHDGNECNGHCRNRTTMFPPTTIWRDTGRQRILPTRLT